MQRWREIAAWLPVIPLALIPLVSSKDLSDPTLLSRQLLYLLFAIAAAWLLFFGSNRKALPDKTLNLLPFLWIAVYALSLMQALNTAEALYMLSKIALYASGLWLTMQLFYTGIWQLKHVLTGTLIAALLAFSLLVSEALTLHVPGNSFWKGNQLYNFYTAFGHKNLYSSFIMLCIPILFMGMVNSNKLVKWVLFIVLMLLTGSLLLMRTRAVWLGIGVGMVVFMLSYLLVMRNSHKTIQRWILISVSVLFTGAVAVLFLKPSVAAFILNNDTARERVLLWDNTLQMIQEHALWGVGAGNWQVWFPKYGLQGFLSTNYRVADGFTTFQRPHNDWLWAWAEAGIPGLLTYGLLLLYPVWVLIQRLRRQRGAEALPNAILLSGISAYLMVMLTDFPLERNEHQWMLALLYGLLFVTADKQTETAKRATHLYGLCALLLVFCGWFAVQRYEAEKHSRNMIIAHERQDMERIRKEAARIHADIMSLNCYAMPVCWYEGIALYALGQHNDALFKFKEAALYNPYQVHVLMNIASLYELKEEHETALEYYNKILAISPQQPDAILNKSAVLYNQGNTRRAFQCLYQLKYDTLNTQFLGYLKSIGSSYAQEYADSVPGLDKIKALPAPLQDLYFKNKFKTSQQKKLTFEEITFE